MKFEVPEEMKAILAHCPRGGQLGHYITIDQQKKFAKFLGTKFIDQVIPLAILHQCHPLDCKKDHDSSDNVYWENDKGSHGWCCEKCGTVIQWG